MSFTIPHGRPRYRLTPVAPIRRVDYPTEAAEGSLVAEARAAQLIAGQQATRSYEAMHIWEVKLSEADMIVARATPDGDFSHVANALASAHVARQKLPDLRKRWQSDREYMDGHAESIRRRMDQYIRLRDEYDDGRVAGTTVSLSPEDRDRMSREIARLVGPPRDGVDW